MTRARFISLLFALLLAMPMALPIPAAGQDAQDAAALEEAERREREILVELEAIERQSAQLEDRLVAIEDEISSAMQALKMGSQAIEKTSARVAEQKKHLAGRLRALYRMRDGGFLPVLIEAESVRDLTRRYRYLRLILKKDEAALLEYGRRIASLQNTRAEVEQDKARLLTLKDELDAERDELEKARRKKTILLMQVHRQKELYLSLEQSREESRERLIKEVIIQPREEAKKEEPPKADEAPDEFPDFARFKGKVPRPAEGKITGAFGRSPGRFNTVVTRNGLVFSAPAGSEVHAVLDGKVIYTGWVKGYGTIVIVDHGNRYYTLTGGLAGIRPKTDAWVRQGQVLGLAPKGGKKDRKEIYFEIRHRGRALDPAPWLGKNVAAVR